MSKNNSAKSKKIKKGAASSGQKKINVARIIIPVVCVIAVFGITFGVIKLVQYNRSKTLEIAFVELPESISEPMKNVIIENAESPVNFSYLGASAVDFKHLSKKYDLLFTFDGEIVSKLKNSAAGVSQIEKISKKCYSNQPSSFYQEDADTLAICLDHFEMDYSNERIKALDIDYPKTLDDLDAFLSEMTKHVFCPFIMEGADDQLLLGFLSCFVESLGGSKGYEAFLDKAASLFSTKPAAEAFNELLDYEIPAANKQPFTLRTIIETLKKWPIKGYTHPSWFIATSSDVDIFMETGHVAAIFTSLQKHRKMPYNNVSKFEANRFPNQTSTVAHGVIMPAVSAVKLINSADINSLLFKLVTPDVQEIISRDTMLGPTASRGQAYDRQADDVRFWGAACSSGPLPDLYNAVFQTNPELGHEAAELVRNELKK